MHSEAVHVTFGTPTRLGSIRTNVTSSPGKRKMCTTDVSAPITREAVGDGFRRSDGAGTTPDRRAVGVRSVRAAAPVIFSSGLPSDSTDAPRG